MAGRAANEALLGYYYQFDKTIESLLDLAASDDTVTVEGIEDFDVSTATETTATQCKHHSGQKYVPSVIRKPICLMLDDFRRVPTRAIKYRLYAHFNDFNEMPERLTLKDLKSLLTYTRHTVSVCYYKEHDIQDSTMLAFLDALTIERADAFEVQHERVIRKLRKQHSCSELEAEVHFYNLALRTVLDHAVKSDIGERTLTKAAFLAKLASVDRAFTAWYLRLKGREEFVRQTRKQLNETGALRSQNVKCLFLESATLSGPQTSLTFAAFVKLLVDKHFCPGKHLIDARPWTIILSVDQPQGKALAKQVLDAGFVINDGYEYVSFTPDRFNDPPLCVKKQSGRGTVDTLGEASYNIRLVTAAVYRAHVAAIAPPDVLLFFSDSQNPDQYVQTESAQVFHFPSFHTLAEVAQIVA